MKETITLHMSREEYHDWYNEPILHDEDEWEGRYRTYGEMWEGEGYIIELNG